MKKLRRLFLALVAVLLVGGCVFGACSSSEEVMLKDLLCNCNGVIYSLSIDSSYIGTFTTEEEISSFLNEVGSIKLHETDGNNDLHILNALTIQFLGDKDVNLYILTDGAVAAMVDEVFYSASAGSADYDVLYSLFKANGAY